MSAGKTPKSERSETALREEKVLQFWKDYGIFQKTLDKKAPKGDFVFYDGPPFATGLPHYGSLLSSIIKDVVPRYKTMQGYRVRRRWGWDCHGLPIENMIEKELGLKTKKDIEKLGIAKFNQAARDSVLRYEHEWERYVERVGRFVDYRNSYKTMDNSFIESVWWALKSLWGKELLYEGRKVLMYCPHCETPLAKAEIAADNTYKDITEEAVTVKFKVKGQQNEYFLAWTTTPWTLPGNVALAVNPKVQYSKVQTGEGNIWLAHELSLKIAPGSPELERVFGSELMGREYEPLFDVPALKSEKSYRVYGADFVTTTDGTGIVHTAVMYGEDDFVLGQKEGLPMVQMLDSSAHYTDKAPEFLRGQYIKKGEKAIKEDLENRGLLFAREMHTHSYPHCWRCGTPLIYNAVASWFINIQKIKNRLLQENENVNWIPEHLKHGRFQNIVENAPDWTISRNRFWASPLPIWKSKKGGVMVVGSVEELRKRVKRSGNRYFIMRHGEGMHMVSGVFAQDLEGKFGLTEKGREQVIKAAKDIPKGMPITILSSPIRRSRETAEIMARELGIPASSIVVDERLREVTFGEFEGRPRQDYFDFLSRPDWLTARPEGGESFEDVKIRFGQAIYDNESRFKDTLVLMVSHRVAFEVLPAVCEGADTWRWEHLVEAVVGEPARIDEIQFQPLPLNEKFVLDLHRPYTDSIVLLDDEGEECTRIPEVIDGWVESGAMPFAEWHYPFENKKEFEARSPGDFIAEYIAQTRTWFYYLHALGVGLFDRQAFRNVISTGTIVAADGSKMSKSKGNYTDPLMLLDRFGADALRYYLMQSVVMQAEDLAFRDEEVREAHNRLIGILWNSYKFFELYKGEFDGKTQSAKSPHALDRWIRSRLGQLIREMTDGMEAYDMPRATRPLRLFVEDYSTWYVRRSRDRVKGEDAQDKQYALATQREVLVTLAKLIAPVMPFIAEDIYRGTGGEGESVHLEAWPEDIAVDEKLLEEMTLVREVASKALEQRERAGLKVRQPLTLLEAKKLPEDEGLRAILAEEVNVKRVAENSGLAEEVWLDTELTPELSEEGTLRDVIRFVQNMRKEKGLSIDHRATLIIETSRDGEKFFTKFKKEIEQETGLRELKLRVGIKTPGATAGFPFFFEPVLNME